MVRISLTEVQKNLRRYLDIALKQPVIVTWNGRDRTVVISVDEYHRLKRAIVRFLASMILPRPIFALSRPPSPLLVRPNSTPNSSSYV